jgi:hypothetical protein
MATLIQLRRDSGANWTSNDPTLANGEFGVEDDASPIKFKIGDGSNSWSSLPYYAAIDDSSSSEDSVWSSDKIATRPITTTSKTSNYTLAAADINTMLLCDHATSISITAPANGTTALDVGYTVLLYQAGAGQITVVEDTGVTINTPETLLSNDQYSVIGLTKIATNEWVVFGRLEAA